jgi:hypothetical protein
MVSVRNHNLSIGGIPDQQEGDNPSPIWIFC